MFFFRASASVAVLLFALTYGVDADAANPSFDGRGRTGANKFDLLMQYTGRASGGDGSEQWRAVTIPMARKALADARELGISYVRVAASGFGPVSYGARSDLEVWATKPDEYWARVDQMMNDLDSVGMRIVPVLMWNVRQFPAETGDTVRELIADENSRSWRLLASYVKEFISRYKGRNTILFYELSNELNLAADLDARRLCERADRGAVCQTSGNFSTDEMIAFTGRFAGLVRATDPSRKISSGFSIPRGSAENLRRKPAWALGGPSWREDSKAEFIQNLVSIHQHCDIISIHLYGDDGSKNRRFGLSAAVDLLDVAKAAADKAGKDLFVGEFGEKESLRANERTHTARMLERIHSLGVPFSAVWAWEFYQQKPYAFTLQEYPAFSLEPGFTDFLNAEIAKANGVRWPPARTGPDRTPPRVVLTWPLPCQRLRGAVNLHATASDDSGRIGRVDFLVDGKTVASVTRPPFAALVDIASVTGAKRRISTLAVDAAGNAAESSIEVLTGRNRAENCTMTQR